MIKDRTELARIQTEWDGVCKLREKIQRHLFIGGARGFSHDLADYAHNLPFLQACGVLNDALKQLRDEDHFPGKGRQTLGALVGAAKDKLHWVDYSAVETIVSERNDLAHRARVLPRKDCWNHISTIEAELRNWSIIP